MESPVEGTKFCAACTTDKPLDDFYRHVSSHDGRQTYCKPCMNARVQLARKAQREAQRIPITTSAVRWPTVNAPRVHPKQYEAMLALQGGVCPGCGQPETALDSHGNVLPLSLYGNATGERMVRVLLCKLCTMCLSCARDDPGILGRLLSIVTVGVRQEVRVHINEPEA